MLCLKVKNKLRPVLPGIIFVHDINYVTRFGKSIEVFPQCVILIQILIAAINMRNNYKSDNIAVS